MAIYGKPEAYAPGAGKPLHSVDNRR